MSVFPSIEIDEGLHISLVKTDDASLVEVGDPVIAGRSFILSRADVVKMLDLIDGKPVEDRYGWAHQGDRSWRISR